MRKPWSGFSGCAVIVKRVKAKRFRPLLGCALSGALLLAGLSAPTHAEERLFELVPPEKKAEDKIQVGDRIPLRLNTPGGESGALKPLTPELAAAALDAGWQLLPGSSPSDLVAVPVKPGSITIPSLPVYPPAPPEAASFGVTVPVTLQVVSAIAQDDPKPEEPAPLRPPTQVALPAWVWVAVFLAAVAVLSGIAWILIRLSRKSRKAEPALLPKSVQPEDVIALKSLNAIAAADWISKGAFKTHYFGISEVLKIYFGARYEIDARESTSAELLVLLEKIALSDGLLDRVEKLFEKLDLVKFTDHLPAVEEGAGLLEEARSLVRLTRRPPPVAPAAAQQGHNTDNKGGQ